MQNARNALHFGCPTLNEAHVSPLTRLNEGLNENELNEAPLSLNERAPLTSLTRLGAYIVILNEIERGWGLTLFTTNF